MAATSMVDRSARDGAVVCLTLTGHAATSRIGSAASVPLGRLDAALLAVLAVEGTVSRQRLLQLLAADDDAEDPRNVLRQRLFRLRRAIGPAVVARGDLLSLADGTTHDVRAGAAADGDDGEGRAGASDDGDLAIGVLLAAHHYDDFPAFASWLEGQRHAAASRWRERLVARIDLCEREGRYADAAALAGRLVAADDLDEAAVQRLMRLRYLDGQRAAAVSAFDRFAAALHVAQRGLPTQATRELLETIRAARDPLPLARRPMPASLLRPPRLIGRDRERRQLHAAWADGRAFWLLGEAGLGKTRLIAEFVGEASGGGAGCGGGAVAPDGSGNGTAAVETLVVPARPGDAGVPYASLGRALRALLERRPRLLESAQRSELARVLPEVGRAAPQVGLGLQLMLQGAIEALLRDAHRNGLAALVVDDLHFADSASLEMLQGLVLADGLTGLRWGFAQRPAEGVAAVEALRLAMEEVQRVDVLALAPLDAAQLAELVASLGLPGIDPAQLAAPLSRHTGGNPMYALETLKHLVAGDLAPLETPLPRPASVGQLIERRLRRLSAQALALARVAAVAGVDFSIDLAEAVVGERALALADAWRELEAAQVLRGDAFAHDLVQEATLAGLPAPIAAHTHGAVAAFLEAHGGEPARVAVHWLDAAQPKRALVALHAAADAARAAMRRKEEAGFLARAARIETDAGDAAAFTSWRAMIDAWWAADLTVLDAPMFDRLDAAASTSGQRAAAQALRANWLQERGDLEPAKRLCRAAIDLAEAAGEEQIAVDARQRLAQMLDWDGDSDAALALLQPLLPWAADRADDGEQAEFYCRLAIAFDNVERGREARAYHQRAIDAARRAGQWNGVVTVLGNLAISWATAGHMQRSIDVLREALQLAAAHDEARGCGAALPAEMYKSLRDCGRYEEALRWIEPALAAEPGVFGALLQCHVACGWIHLGQHARAQREIDAALAAKVPDWVRAKALQMRARLKLALGQRGARALLEEALLIAQAQPGRRALRAAIRLDHALALEPAAARAEASLVIAEGERLDLPGTALAGHIRAARFAVDAGDAGDAVAHAQAALSIDDGVAPNDLYPAERWLQAWRAWRLAGRDDEAREVLRRGVEWVRSTTQTQVPEPFRDSFCRANPVNQALLRAQSS